MNKYTQEDIVMSVSAVVPSVRCAVVAVSAWRGDGGEWEESVEIAPVLALQVTVTHCYSRPGSEQTHRGLVPDLAINLRNGWVFVDNFINYDAIVISEEFGVWEAEKSYYHENQCYSVVACPWPFQSADEDEIWLQNEIADVLSRARGIVEYLESDEGNAA